ncbi:MAG: Ig-like domain-containing protein, partial [Candidatus Limnocylindrales bacterium]
MFRRLCAALAASALIAGLLVTAPVVATDGVPPTCNPGSASVDEDGALNGSVSCSDTEAGDMYDVVSNVSDGVLNLDLNDGSFSYTPDADFFGSDPFTYRLLGGPDGESTTETFTISVTAVNDAPSFTKGPNQNVPEN